MIPTCLYKELNSKCAKFARKILPLWESVTRLKHNNLEVPRKFFVNCRHFLAKQLQQAMPLE